MKAFVTGASGYIGFSAASALARAGHEVHGLIRRTEVADRLRAAEIRPVMGTLQEPTSFLDVTARCSVIVHAAVDYQADTRALDRATIEALLGTAERGARPKTVIYTSGAWIYGDTGDGMADETAPLHPASTDRAREQVERLVLESTVVRGLVIRPGCVYGGRGGLTGLWFDGAERGEIRVIGDGRNHWSMVHAADLGEAYVRLSESGLRGEVFNVTDRSRATVNDMAGAIAAAAGRDVKITHVPVAEAARQIGGMAEALALNQHLDSRKAVSLLGWQPRHGGFVDGAAICYAAWKASR